MSTPHIGAENGEIAKTVLMPGDPKRAKFVAETFFENIKQVTDIRGMLGFTGTYKGKPVSVMGSGMGMPSIGIYSYELYTQYDVEEIIRIGSCGAYDEKLKLFDVLITTESYSHSSYAKEQNGCDDKIMLPSKELVQRLHESAKALNIPLIESRIHSSDVFYTNEPIWQHYLKEYGCQAVEMESFALFHNANVCGKKAACVLTVSDSLSLHQETTPEQREKSFTQMMEVALGAL